MCMVVWMATHRKEVWSTTRGRRNAQGEPEDGGGDEGHEPAHARPVLPEELVHELGHRGGQTFVDCFRAFVPCREKGGLVDPPIEDVLIHAVERPAQRGLGVPPIVAQTARPLEGFEKAAYMID